MKNLIPHSIRHGIVLLTGLFCAGFGLSLIYHGYACKSWPTCEGTVVESEVKVMGGRRDSYAPKIKYSYTVSGKAYTSDRYAYGDTHFWEERDAKKIVGKYPPGSPVTIYYSSWNPGMSVLAPGVDSTAWYLLAGGVGCVLIAVLSIRFSRI